MGLGFLAPLWEGNVSWLLCQARAVEEAAAGKLGKRGQCLLFARESLFSQQVSSGTQMCSWKKYWMSTAVSDSAVLEPLSVWNNLKCLHITASEGEFEVKAEPGAVCQLARAVTAVLWKKKKNPKWDERRPTAREFLFCCCGALTLPSYTFASDLL